MNENSIVNPNLSIEQKQKFFQGNQPEVDELNTTGEIPLETPSPEDLAAAAASYDEIEGTVQTEGILNNQRRFARSALHFGVTQSGEGEDGKMAKEGRVGEKEPKFVWENIERDEERLRTLREFSVIIDIKRKNGEEITEEQQKNVEEYAKFKEYLAEQKRKHREAKIPEDITPEERASKEKEINDRIFDELVVDENSIYLRKLKNLSSEGKDGILNKGLEAAKSLLSTKAAKWYLGLSKNQRRALSFGVGGMVGIAAGAAVAPGMAGVATYLGWRALRFGVSGFVGNKASERANKRWSLEDLEVKKNKEVEKLKNSNMSLEDKAKALRDIENDFKKAKIIISAKRIGSTIVAGAGAGMLTGLAEGLTTSVNASVNMTKISPTAPKVEVAPTIIGPAPKGGENVVIRSLFEDKSVLNAEAKPGDSTWKLLGNAVEKSRLFKKLTGPEMVVDAKKDFILSNLINENNLASGGPLKVGDKVDFTKVFEDKEKIEMLFKKAEAISNQNVINIRINNEKIEAWLADPANKGKALTPDVVKEILQKKVEPKTFAFNQGPTQTEPPKIILDETIKQAGLVEPKLEVNIAELNNNYQSVFSDNQVSEDSPTISAERLLSNIKKTQEELAEQRARYEDGRFKYVFSEDEIKKRIQGIEEKQIQVNDLKSRTQELIKSKVRLPEIAQNEAVEGVEPVDTEARVLNASTEKVTNIEEYRNRGIRTMQGDSKKLVAEIVSNEKIEEHLRADINNIYGKKGIFGIGKVEGINTPGWKEISEQNAAKFLGFYEKPENSDLPKKIIENLTVSREDRDLVEYIDGLRNEAKSAAGGFLGVAGSDVAPYNNETVGEYLRRLGKFIMEHPKVEIPNSVSGMRRAA